MISYKVLIFSIMMSITDQTDHNSEDQTGQNSEGGAWFVVNDELNERLQNDQHRAVFDSCCDKLISAGFSYENGFVNCIKANSMKIDTKNEPDSNISKFHSSLREFKLKDAPKTPKEFCNSIRNFLKKDCTETLLVANNIYNTDNPWNNILVSYKYYTDEPEIENKLSDTKLTELQKKYQAYHKKLIEQMVKSTEKLTVIEWCGDKSNVSERIKQTRMSEQLKKRTAVQG